MHGGTFGGFDRGLLVVMITKIFQVMIFNVKGQYKDVKDLVC